MRVSLPRSPFSISLTLHASILLILIVSTVFQGCSEPEEDFIFEIVNLDLSVVQPTSEPPQPSIQSIEPEPLPDTSFSRLEPTRDRPVIEQSPIAPSQPVEPAEIPKAVPEPQLQRISADEFRRQFGEPKPRTRPQPTRPAQPRIKTPSIDTSRITQSLEDAANQQTSPSSSSSMAQDMARFDQRVKQFLETQWRARDVDLPAQSLFVEVLFSWDSNGRITNYRIVKSSGLTSLDREVSRFFASIPAIPAPPNRKAGQRTIPVGID